MKAGDKFAVMLVPNGTVRFRLHYPGDSLGCIAGTPTREGQSSEERKQNQRWLEFREILDNSPVVEVVDNVRPNPDNLLERVGVWTSNIPGLSNLLFTIRRYGSLKVIDTSSQGAGSIVPPELLHKFNQLRQESDGFIDSSDPNNNPAP